MHNQFAAFRALTPNWSERIHLPEVQRRVAAPRVPISREYGIKTVASRQLARLDRIE
jgi:hypothetical protein